MVTHFSMEWGSGDLAHPDPNSAFVGRISGSQVRVNLDVLYCTTVRSSGPPPPNADRLAVRAKWTHWNSARTLSTTSSSAPKMTNIDENGAVSRRPVRADETYAVPQEKYVGGADHKIMKHHKVSMNR